MRCALPITHQIPGPPSLLYCEGSGKNNWQFQNPHSDHDSMISVPNGKMNPTISFLILLNPSSESQIYLEKVRLPTNIFRAGVLEIERMKFAFAVFCRVWYSIRGNSRHNKGVEESQMSLSEGNNCPSAFKPFNSMTLLTLWSGRVLLDITPNRKMINCINTSLYCNTDPFKVSLLSSLEVGQPRIKIS